VHRFTADSVHYVTPAEDNQYQVAKMRSHGAFSELQTEIGRMIVADVNTNGSRSSRRRISRRWGGSSAMRHKRRGS